MWTGQYCDICSSANSNKAHPITNAIDGTERWWQSPPLSRGLEFNQVNVTLDLGQGKDVQNTGVGTPAWPQGFGKAARQRQGEDGQGIVNHPW
ncbi:hypothetical protein IHE44_0004664 [Lamprotornis superbus]|uniref:Laminin N-terminal domain-containing protein n=1 Tax=Lamprotornis superbus TaxID=245042 RepID=A0A835U049_9PASS|nr:hypothetical protein IHE44_0004664 [Lamprotornis superbus]